MKNKREYLDYLEDNRDAAEKGIIFIGEMNYETFLKGIGSYIDNPRFICPKFALSSSAIPDISVYYKLNDPPRPI